MREVFKNIEEIRREKGIKQTVIAELMGVTQSAYSNYVNRNEDITLSRLTQIANIFRMSVIDILTYPIKYAPETENCEDCRQFKVEIKHLTEYIEVLKSKKK